MSNGHTRFNPYSRKLRKELDGLVDIRLRNQWFENYYANKPLIEKHGGLVNMPLLESAIIVGAGWSLEKNIHLLKGCKVPVISTDKALKRVMEQAKPFAVCALNTGATEISQWLDVDSEGIWLVAPVTAHPDTFKTWKGPIAFVNPQNTCQELYELVQRETGIIPTIRGCNSGYFSLITAYTLNAKTAVLLGMNYSYQTEGEALAATHNNHVIKMMDVTGNYTYTVLDWLDARREFMDFCFEWADEFRVVNCSEGGILYEANLVEHVPFALWREWHAP